MDLKAKNKISTGIKKRPNLEKSENKRTIKKCHIFENQGNICEDIERMSTHKISFILHRKQQLQLCD